MRYARECLSIHPRRRINSIHLIEVLTGAMFERGIPEFIRPGTGPEFTR
jgi:hypothetical protein